MLESLNDKILDHPILKKNIKATCGMAHKLILNQLLKKCTPNNAELIKKICNDISTQIVQRMEYSETTKFVN